MDKYNSLDFNLILEEIREYLVSVKLKSSFLNTLIKLDKAGVERSLDEIICAKYLVKDKVYLFDFDYNISDIITLINSGYYLKLDEVVKIREEIKLAHNLKVKYSFLSDLKYNLAPLKEYFNTLFSCKQIKDKIDNLIDNDNNFKSDCSLEYAKIISSFNLIEEKIAKTYKQLLSKYSKYLIDKNIYLKDDRKCFLIDIQYKNILKGNVVDISNSGRGVFFEPDEVQELNKELFFIIASKKKEEARLLKNITLVIKKDLDKFISNQKIYQSLDLIFAKGIYASKYNLNKISINTKKEIKITNVRHPLINPDKVVPISLNFLADKYIYLLTGANTGGKTVAIKTVGLCALMLLYGLPLPMDMDSSMHLFDEVYAQIGDSQSIQGELSKFSSEITNLKKITTNATSNSLVIIDEPTSGTDPLEGGSLACAIVNYFIKRKIKVMLSSHYSLLKELAIRSDYITYASVVFDSNTLLPTYHLNEGVIGESKGILTAKRYGLNEEIITNASTIFNQLKPESELLMDKIRTKEEALKQKEVYLKEKEQKLLLSEQSFIKEKEKIIKNYDLEYTNKVALLSKEVDKLKDELRKSISEKNIITKKNALNKELNTTLDFEYSLNVGDSVLIVPYQKTGEIVEIKKDKYLVSFLNFKMLFEKNELRPKAKKEIVKTPNLKKYNTQNLDDINTNYKNIIELDLRGKRYNEVYNLIDSYISLLLEQNLFSGRIIIGYGTGAVRKATIEYLKQSKYIKNYHYADEYSGQMGAIVINLK